MNETLREELALAQDVKNSVLSLTASLSKVVSEITTFVDLKVAYNSCEALLKYRKVWPKSPHLY